MSETTILVLSWVLTIVGGVIGGTFLVLALSIIMAFWGFIFVAGVLYVTGYSCEFMLKSKDKGCKVIKRGPWNGNSGS